MCLTSFSASAICTGGQNEPGPGTSPPLGITDIGARTMPKWASQLFLGIYPHIRQMYHT
ncbi:unnamed protein product [Callosobruchus maculatus]|uniref:Uncharacterized protein n=1 Tax=Callosobruchus maculatus TaxID=64391 RepID=A0A653BM87_CALMS|nr:unnamed protein product [Callosobruchus maculatus]